MKLWTHTAEYGRECVNPGTEEEMRIEGYQRCTWRQALFYVLYLATAGLLRLVFHWQPVWMLRATHTRCHLHLADKVLLTDIYDNKFVCTIKIATKDGTRVRILESSNVYFSRRGQNSAASVEDLTLIKYFTCKKLKYIWQPDKMSYTKLGGLEAGHSCADIHELSQAPLSDMERRRRQVLYGDNAIDVHVTPIIRLLTRQMLTPLYVFQMFSCILWFTDEYEIYATCILVISGGCIANCIYGTRRVERDLRRTVDASGFVIVKRGDLYVDMPHDQLVPGDIIEIPKHTSVMHCDAVLLTGNCIVNENMLTGESVPVTKTPLVNNQDVRTRFSVKEHAKNILFCGTKVIQTRYYRNHKVLGLVIRTGYMTTKGELVRSIMFPKPEHFRFSQDVYKFIGFLACMAGVGFTFTVVLMWIRGSSMSLIVRRALDLITIVVPPALPVAMEGSSLLARERLKKCQISCISHNSITVCGAVNLVCFDKTGTLTEDGLDLKVVVPVENQAFSQAVREPFTLSKGRLLTAMATCHSLTRIEGELSGDPLDLKMFEATQWTLDEMNEDDVNYDSMMPTVVKPSQESGDVMEDVGMVRQFTFSSKLQRMSVVTKRVLDKHFILYVKGSPEKIFSLSKPGSVPADFHTVLSRYTEQGHRVIALAWRSLNLNYTKLQRVQREDVERDLNFVGLLVMENRVKAVTAPTIRLLNKAKIRTLMITGDNLLTALSVGRESLLVRPDDRVVVVQVTPPMNQNPPTIEYLSGDDDSKLEMGSKDELIIPIDDSKRLHFAMTGKTWELLNRHYPKLVPKISVRGTIFARMAPEQKAQLIERLQDLGYYVSMCGDGANDCAALKSAHVGISLSEAEASIASPFTSKEADIRCVPNLIREGRCALVTSFGIFKFTASYSLTQFTSVLILYWISCNFTDWEFVYIDLFVLTSLCISYSLTGAYEDLVPKRPAISLISPLPLISLIMHMLIIIGVQAWAFWHIQTQPWFVPYVPNEEEDHYGYENGAVFLVSVYQYLTMAVVFSRARPYRKSIFTNYWFMANIGVLLAMSLLLTIGPPEALAKFMELRLPASVLYRLIYVGIALANFIVCYMLERYLIQNPVLEKLAKKLKNKITKPTKDKYVQLQHEIDVDPDWPPISPSSLSLAELTKMEVQPANEEPSRVRTISGLTVCSVDEEERPLTDSRDDRLLIDDVTSRDVMTSGGKPRHQSESGSVQLATSL